MTYEKIIIVLPTLFASMWLFKISSVHTCIWRGLSEKCPAIVNIMRTVCVTSMYHGSQGEWAGMHMCEQWQRHCTSQRGQ